MNISPVGDQVLVKIDPTEKKSSGGLYLPVDESAVKDTGVVVAVGDHEKVTVKPGDHVLLDKGMGRRFTMPVEKEDTNGYKYTFNEPYILISFYDILALLED